MIRHPAGPPSASNEGYLSFWLTSDLLPGAATGRITVNTSGAVGRDRRGY
jgi:hypothetical protein